ncbi:hypothetical protein FIA58_001915 [Flavobacterium jejuense]|uniref:Uncharacterized protein n=1 Tax=Flavobacterium jejuense TaxID=1544455 RepID=A0ABX0IPM8_9FLAO|nr:hypothetical protein [Flavobacterium jejuense]NHN24418.1 hypothetical protein [Flavobacterium jejuense]
MEISSFAKYPKLNKFFIIRTILIIVFIILSGYFKYTISQTLDEIENLKIENFKLNIKNEIKSKIAYDMNITSLKNKID